MTANLGFIMHAAQRHASELSVQCARNGAAQRSFTHTRRSHEAQDRPLHARLQLQHGKVIQNAVFDLFQVVVVLIQNLMCLGDVHLNAA